MQATTVFKPLSLVASFSPCCFSACFCASSRSISADVLSGDSEACWGEWRRRSSSVIDCLDNKESDRKVVAEPSLPLTSGRTDGDCPPTEAKEDSEVKGCCCCCCASTSNSRSRRSNGLSTRSTMEAEEEMDLKTCSCEENSMSIDVWPLK